ncbi:MAG: LamG domain-containing protein [Planctomycetota bacterium]|nr:LamG domain-containing protein [Planctomycetota bacterium]
MCRKPACIISFVFVVGLVFAGVARSADPGLVAWYRFDGDASDSSGNNLHGTEMGDPTYEPGVFGQSISLDGDGDYVDCGLAPEFDITEFITFTYWIKVVAFDRGWNTVISRGDDSWRSSRAGTNNYMEAAVGGTVGNYTYGVTPVDDGEWHHVGWVYDGTMNYLYLDGEVDATEENSGQITVSSYPLYIGDNSQATGRFWNGLIDDVMIYNRALTQEEVQRIMQSSAGAYPQASGPNPADGTLHEDTWVTMSWRAGDFAVSHDVYMSDNFDDVSNGADAAFQGNQASEVFIVGFPGFPYPDGLVPGTTYYWRIDEVNDTEPNSPWKGDIWSFLIPPKTAYNPDPADGAEFVDPNAVLTWTPGFGAKMHTVYMGTNFDEVNDAAGGTPVGSASYSPGTLESEKVYYWRVDEFDPPFTHKGNVWGFTTPGAVGNPQPANGEGEVQMNATLSWTAADNAASHELYFGADADAVKNATTASPEYIGTRALGSESYDPGKLAWDAAYYWRVDEVYPAETVKGLAWSFATADFILVEDFESYNDIDPPDAASNRIFDKWIDGFGTTTNGALVGNDLPPYAEQTTVHGGSQSMPYLYDNNLKTSEATLALTYPVDWTEEGVTKLSIMFRGSSANSAERMFVALGNATVYHSDPAATQITGWNEWVIDLAAFGVDLTNVPSITIGFGTRNSPAAGDVGTMYFDDVRLVR